MPLTRNNVTALYRQIADRLRHEISAGQFEPTGRLPSEAELSKRFAVSRVTVRLALDELDQEGLLERRKGKGTFIAGKGVVHELDSLRSFHESLKMQGLRATMRVTDLKVVPTPTACASLPGARCTLLERLHLVDHEPIALGRSFLAQDMEGVGLAVASRLPTYALLEQKTGQKIVQADIAISSHPASAHVAGMIHLAEGSHVLVLERRSYDANNQCVEFSEFFIRPERYRFTLGRIWVKRGA